MKKIWDVDLLFLELDREHYNSLYYVIETNIKSVGAKQRNTNGKVTDFIDDKIKKESSLTCTVCKKDELLIPYPKTTQKCNICHTQLTKTVENSTTQIKKVCLLCSLKLWYKEIAEKSHWGF